MSTADGSNPEPSVRGTAVYVHIPYCLEKCPYCDFNSYGVGDGASKRTAEFRESEYCKALLAELAYYAAQNLWQNRTCSSVFFGGGTPSLFSVESISTILDAIKASFVIDKHCEITLESNPGTISETLGYEKLLGFRQAGVMRISLGAQSFQPEKLKTLGRWHSPDDTRASVANIVKAGFSNFNLDLMFGVPGENAESWKSDLETAISLNPSHIASYGLTIESGTEFAVRVRKGLMQTPDDNVQADFYRDTQETLAAAGYRQYEISNFAKTGRECRHNLSYWQWDEYLGLGAGAHSFVRTANTDSVAQRWSNIPKPSHYIDRAAEHGDCSQRRDKIDKLQAEGEFLLCGLRTSNGISAKQFRANFQEDLFKRYASVIDQLSTNDLLRKDAERIYITEKGFLFADSILAEFAASPAKN